MADEQTATGGQFAYAANSSRLLHMPLETGLENLSPGHQRFVAGRSMRDVEHNVYLKIKDPYGQTIADAKDIS